MTIVEMAIVILIIGILTAILVPAVNSIALFRSNKDEADMLKDTMDFARQSATMSGQAVYLELNIDEDSYSVYRMDRMAEGVKKEMVVERASMSPSGKIVAVSMASGNRVSSGVLKVVYQPFGSSEEVSIHLGPEPRVTRTVHQYRYGGHARILRGEDQLPWSQDEKKWSDNLEDW